MEQEGFPVGESSGHEAQVEGESATDVGKRLFRKPSLIILVLSVAVITAVTGVAVFPAPFQTLPGIIGVPLIVWLIHRDRQSESPPG